MWRMHDKPMKPGLRTAVPISSVCLLWIALQTTALTRSNTLYCLHAVPPLQESRVAEEVASDVVKSRVQCRLPDTLLTC